MTKIKVLLVDDHAVVRKGLISLLEDEDSLEIIADVSSGKEAINFIASNKLDLVLLDLNMPEMSGLETSKILSKTHPKLKKLVFSMHNDPDYILKSIENGVDGYLLKDSEKDEIVKAIEQVNAGQKYFPTTISSILVDALQTKKTISKTGNSVLQALSKKELEILRLVAEGLSSQEIAEKLELSVRTVSNHRANMLRKTNINNTTELVGILKSEEK